MQDSMRALNYLSSCLVLTGIVVLYGSTASLQAKQPVSVRFDASRAIGCRVVRPPRSASAEVGTKLIEAQFRVSVLVSEGKPENVEDVVVLIEGPHCRLRVVDFSPKTEMANSVEGEVQTTRTVEKTATAGAQIGLGSLPPLYGLPSATLSGSQHHVVAQTFKELPSKCLVLASGTTDGGHGVFFKVKGTPQVPLEGTKDFTCTFEVPNDWRGDWCLLACHARGLSERNKKFESCGQAEIFVGLYLEGDEHGQAVARQLDLLQLPQAANSVHRLALGVPANAEQTAIALGYHKSFRATLASWSNNPGLFDQRATQIAIEEMRTNVALQVTLDELSGMAGH
jgi:hypothetical protein